MQIHATYEYNIDTAFGLIFFKPLNLSSYSLEQQ